MTSEAPSYEEAVSEAHRPGHEWLWEPCSNGRACKLCGHIESFTEMAAKLDRIKELLDSRNLPDDHAWSYTANRDIRAILNG